MFAPEELIVMEDKMQSPMFSISIQIPNEPDFGDFEEMPRAPPVLKKHLTDHIGTDQQSDDESQSTISVEEAIEYNDEEHNDYITIEIMEGYTCTICVAGMTDEEIDNEIENKKEEILDMMLDGYDNYYD